MDRSLDSTNQLGEVLGLHDHLRDALWRAGCSRRRGSHGHIGTAARGGTVEDSVGVVTFTNTK